MTEPQIRLLRKLPDDCSWVDVPTATRGRTISAMVKNGDIAHRPNPKRSHWMDWLAWGQVRKLKPGDENTKNLSSKKFLPSDDLPESPDSGDS
jgi:hypothetical protein